MTWLILYLGVGAGWAGSMILIGNGSLGFGLVHGALWPLSVVRFAILLRRNLR